MFGPILKEAVVLIVFCHIFVSGKDLLEVFRPNPSLPRELNEWLANVQKHKNDFRLIREVVSKKDKKAKIQFEDEDDEDFEKKDFGALALEDEAEDQKSENLDEAPKNDIYPYMYKSNSSPDSRMQHKETNSDNVKSPVRLRRASDDSSFVDRKNFVNFEPQSKVGEIKRSGEKYPERFKESFSENEDSKAKSSFNEKKEPSDVEKEVNKRDVQIDIRKDGKLIKQIKEDENVAKSIVLNIQPDEKRYFTAQVPLVSPRLNLEAKVNSNFENKNKVARLTPAKAKYPPERSAGTEVNQMKNKEFFSNFKNLFTANEHLNTDASLARDSISTMGPLIYHVTIPEFNTAPDTSYSYSLPVPYIFQNMGSNNVGDNSEGSPNLYSAISSNITGSEPNQYNYNRNNLQDMSQFWTASEKQQMQKGIAMAQNNDNFKKVIPHIKFSTKLHTQTDNETGFEPAQRIEVDNGKLVKISSSKQEANSEKVTEANDLKMNYFKRNNGLLNNNEEIIEINSGNANRHITNINKNVDIIGISAGKARNPFKPSNIAEANRNIDVIEINSGKSPFKNYKPSSNSNRNVDIIEIKGDKANFHKENNIAVDDKDTIPNYLEPSKIHTKRELEYLQGKVNINNNNINPHDADNLNRVKFSNTADAEDNRRNVDGSPEVKFSNAADAEDNRRNIEDSPGVKFSNTADAEDNRRNVDGSPEVKFSNAADAEDNRRNLEGSPEVFEEAQNDEPRPNQKLFERLERTTEGVTLTGLLTDPANAEDSVEANRMFPAESYENPLKDVENTRIENDVQGPLYEKDEEPIKENYEKVDVSQNVPADKYADYPADNSADNLADNQAGKVPEAYTCNKCKNTNVCKNNCGKTHIRKLHTHVERDRLVTETVSEVEGSDLKEDIEGDPDRYNGRNSAPDTNSFNANPNLHGKSLQQSQDRGLAKSHSKARFSEDDIQNFPYNEPKTNIFKQRANALRRKLDPNFKRIVAVHNRSPYYPTKRKSARYRNYVNTLADKSADYNDEVKPEKIDNFHWAMENQRPTYNRQAIRQLPPNLIIRKRASPNSNRALVRKRYRRRHYGRSYLGKLYSDFDGIKNQRPNELETYLNENDDAFEADAPASSNLALGYIGRQLKAVDYEYDAYLDKPGEDYYEDVTTRLPESEGRAELLKKDSVEGDYGDEEDSVTDKVKKNDFNIVKKTHNEFANPRTTTESEDDYYNEDYDRSSYCPGDGEKKSGVPRRSGSKQKSEQASDDKDTKDSEEGYTETSEFSHHLQQNPNKFKSKVPRKRTHLTSAKSSQKIKDKRPRDVASHKIVRKSAGNRRNKKKIPRQAFFDKQSEFQHWPTFVINDHDNEETLRKRSLVFKNKYPRSYSFPLASKDFFVKTQKKRKASEPPLPPSPTEKSTDKPATLNEMEVPVTVEKRLLGDETEKPTVIAAQTSNDLSATVNVVRKEADINADVPCEATVCPNETPPCLGKPMSNVCEENEKFNDTTQDMTTILSIENQSEAGDNETSHGIYEKLDDMLSGEFPTKLVSDIFEEVKKSSRLKHRFNKGLQITNRNLNLNFQNLDDANGKETRKIINSMSCLMDKLQLVSTCQLLPRNLKVYLKSITKIKKDNPLARTKEMEEIELDDTQNKKNFIFESAPRPTCTLQDKVQILKDLLAKYNNLPDKCKSRAEPVKEYIENHLVLLNGMLGACESSAKRDIPNRIDRSNNSPKTNQALVEEQLESVGLGKEHRFVPQFDLEQMIQQNRLVKSVTPGENQVKARPQNANVNKRDLSSVSRSKKYNKLLDAVRKVQLRKEGERRLAEVFGKSSDYSGFNFNSKSNEDKDVAKANFESPLVYSL